MADVTGQHHAARGGNVALANLLLQTKDLSFLHVEDDNGQTPLWLAAGHGHEAMVAMFLDLGININGTSDYLGSPLSEAALRGHIAVVSTLLARGADPNWCPPEWGHTPLTAAAESGNEAVVRLLLAKGASVDARASVFGRTALCVAAAAGHEGIVRILLENGAAAGPLEPSQLGVNDRPLFHAVRKGSRNMVQMLLDHGAGGDPESFTELLFEAARRLHVGVIDLMIARGADVNAKDASKQTPLICAILATWREDSEAKEAMVRALLEAGAECDTPNEHGWTPLLLAAQEGKVPVMKLLVERGANLEAEDFDGRTPLSWAGWNRNKEAVLYLLDQGVDSDGYIGQKPSKA
jgi:ankyrin repeat protein